MSIASKNTSDTKSELKKYDVIRTSLTKKINTDFKLLTVNMKPEIFENLIYSKASNIQEYLSIFYDITYDYELIMNNKNINMDQKKKQVGNITKNILNDKILTKRPSFDIINKKIKEQYDYHLNPGTVQSSPFPCRKCNKRNVKSFVFQSRSCDEGQTELNVCQSCRHQWTN